MRIGYFMILCLFFLMVGCSRFQLETPRESESSPSSPEVYDEDIHK